MKILVTGRGLWNNGGPEPGLFERDQAKALKALGHDVRFGAVDTRSVRRKRPFGLQTAELDGIRVYYAALPAGAKPEFLSLAAQRRCAGMIWDRLAREDWRPNVIHAHFGEGFLKLAKKNAVPLVYTEHFSATAQADPSPAELRREKRTYALADRIICVSSSLAAHVKAHTGAEAVVVPNILDTGAFPLTKHVPREGSFRFVSAGNFYRIKGFDILLRGFAALLQRIPAVQLTLIGSGEEENALRALVLELGLGESVRFAGRLTRPQMSKEYENADAFVLASRSETFGVVYIEAMAAGLPVIATRCGGPEDFVDKSNGILIPKEDEDALAAAMERMIRTREQYDAAAISAFAREKFSPETIARQLTQVYEEIARC